MTAQDRPTPLDRVRHYIAMRKAAPLRNLGDDIHGIHIGTEYGAELKLSDLEAVVGLLASRPLASVEGMPKLPEGCPEVAWWSKMWGFCWNHTPDEKNEAGVEIHPVGTRDLLRASGEGALPKNIKRALCYIEDDDVEDFETYCEFAKEVAAYVRGASVTPMNEGE